MTLDELRKIRDTYPFRPVILVLKDGRQILLESIGITPKGVVLAVSPEKTFFLVPEQIVERGRRESWQVEVRLSSDQIIIFVQGRPFVPFRAHLIGGRSIEVRHSDYVTVSSGGMGFWLLHDSGHVEAIAGEAVVSIETLEIVDPHVLTG